MLLFSWSLLCSMITSFDGIRFRHVLAVLGISVPAVTLSVIDLGVLIHPNHTGAGHALGYARSGGCRF